MCARGGSSIQYIFDTRQEQEEAKMQKEEEEKEGTASTTGIR